MSFKIPRIQYNNVDTTGSTYSGNAQITGIPDTTDIVVGMFVRGSGVPTGATVQSKTNTTVTMNTPNVASGTYSNTALNFGYEILFDYPPKEPTGENIETSAVISESLSGERQVSYNYIELKRNLTFSFLSPAIYTLMDTFLKNWACLGYEFRYYEDQTSSTYTDYELDKLNVTFKKIAPRSETTYVWEIPLVFRRVL